MPVATLAIVFSKKMLNKSFRSNYHVKREVTQVSFDEFLNRSYYESYIIHDYDITSKDIDKGLTDPRMIRQEQQRVENEILDFEQDLWTN